MRPFIVIEALDAGGSQTQTDMLARKLKREGYIPHQYHFPREDAATGRLIYEKFLHEKNNGQFTRREQALLYVQDFYSRLDEMYNIVEQGSAKDVIVSDRYCTSTMAYQTIGMSDARRRAMLAWIKWLCWEGTPQLLKPTVVIFLDTPVAVSLRHLSNKKRDYFESRAKLTAIRRSYLRLAKEQQWVVIDSMDKAGKRQRSKRDIHQEVWEVVRHLL